VHLHDLHGVVAELGAHIGLAVHAALGTVGSRR
jgi:hypothetical protein